MEGDDDLRALLADLEGGQAGGGEDPLHALNQDEIDSLLGFDAFSSGDSDTGILALIERSLTAYEKLPMLEVVFDRLVRMLSTSFRNITSDNVEVSIDSISSLRFGDYLNTIPLPTLLVIFRAIEWENLGLINLDSTLIYSFVDVLLGGRRANRPLRIEGRPYTTIEQSIVKRVTDQIMADMSAAFDPISPINFEHERIENNPRFATIARPSSAAILIRMRVDMEDRGGTIEVLLPYATLEPVRELLLQMFTGEKFGRDSSWDMQLTKEIRQTDLLLEAALRGKVMKLGDVINFKVGKTILLDSSPTDPIEIRAGDVPVIVGKVGKSGDRLAVRVDELPNRKDFLK